MYVGGEGDRNNHEVEDKKQNNRSEPAIYGGRNMAMLRKSE